MLTPLLPPPSQHEKCNKRKHYLILPFSVADPDPSTIKQKQ
jgi:hypothetical protein